MTCSRIVLMAFCMLLAMTPAAAFAIDADCYDKGTDYYIPASNMLEAKKKALVCFFADISIKSSLQESNESVKVEQETSLEAKSAHIDWSRLRRDRPGLFRWAITDVSENIKRLRDLKTKKSIQVEKEVEEVWDPKVIKKSIIEISTDPPGAAVTLDGVEHSCVTPCKREMVNGDHTLVLKREDYARRETVITVDGTRPTLAFNLREIVGRIALSDCPAGASVLLDGNFFGTTPLGTVKADPGQYVLEIKHPEYFLLRKKNVAVKAGQTYGIECAMKPKNGAISISAVTSSGEPIHASVKIDGESQKDATPATYTMRIGDRRVLVSVGDQVWEGGVVVEFKKTISRTVTLSAPTPPEPFGPMTLTVESGLTNFDAADSKIRRKSSSFYNLELSYYPRPYWWISGHLGVFQETYQIDDPEYVPDSFMQSSPDKIEVGSMDGKEVSVGTGGGWCRSPKSGDESRCLFPVSIRAIYATSTFRSTYPNEPDAEDSTQRPGYGVRLGLISARNRTFIGEFLAVEGVKYAKAEIDDPGVKRLVGTARLTLILLRVGIAFGG